MATHDYVIANGTGAAVRSDLNNALAAIVSNNSSSSEPGTTYAYQWWADTNANVLKLRNSANDGWITLRELDGTMLIEDGSASTPGLAFADDVNTGIFSPAADKIGFATGGAERLEIGSSEVVFNDPSNDVDFRIESNNNTHIFFVDAGNDHIGIGASSPGNALHVLDNFTDSFVNPTDAVLRIQNANTSGTTTQTSIAFTSSTSGSGADSAIVSQAEDGSGNSSLQFWTDTANGMSEKARIDSSGNLGVGVTPSAWGGSRNAIQFDSAGAAYLCNDSTMGIASNFYFDGSANKYLTTAAAAAIYVQNGNIHFDIAPSGTAGNSASFNTRVRIDDDGLKFNSDTAADNALDDYEEGFFTPTLVGAGGGAAAAYSRQNAGYVKVGNVVHVYGYLKVSSKGSSISGSLKIGGFPFSTKNDANYFHGPALGWYTGFSGVTVYSLGFDASPNQTSFTLARGSGTGVTSVSLSQITDTFGVEWAFTYRTE